ncbi:MAG: GNAT family N-acetyltransferase [Desulfosarcina sp.]|nr:GNAT family N-acetyltransferase [Desulfosarcina sp.]MBC2744101.1 GNAT family N-acetyltransferase [Desulfosarcina sp.]MBC2767010.1 GNAT family N-acetyltransferase [Desulfosarcina sp.]
MADNSYWADSYVQKRCTAEDAIGRIRNGQRVFIGSSCGEPQHLVKTLSEAATRFTDLEIVRLMSLETAPLSLIADRTRGQRLNIRSFYMGSAKSKHLAEKARFLTPLNLSAVPRLFKSQRLPIHVALIQATPPDDFGWMSLGVSVDITLAAASSADLVIVQVNPEMPRVLGRSFIHVNDVHLVVEKQEPILTLPPGPESEAADTIARLIARLIEDGSTLQISPGTTSQATMMTLWDKNDLGIHTQFMTNEIMHLFARGVITNRRKGLNNGKMVASSAIGPPNLYEFINDNPAVEFYPSDYVNALDVIAGHNKMVSLSVAMAMDLTGQVAADALAFNNFSGVTGMLDFVRGAFQSEGGRSIIMLPATAVGGKKSRIVPMLGDTAVVVPRADVHYVATEFGVVNLFGKSLQERATAMISIAHPDFRDELLHQAKQMNLIGAERTLKGSLHGVYPLRLEETLEIDGETVTIRPAKPVDERRIQEHFYALDKNDIVSRFFHEKTSFVHDDVGEVSQVDYIKNLTILAVVGEFGFGKVVGIGEYLLDPSCNLAEVAFSVSGPWQGKGLGKRMMKKLFEGSLDNGIAGFTAYTAPENQGMIGLFNSLPANVSTTLEDGMVALSCRFDDLKR